MSMYDYRLAHGGPGSGRWPLGSGERPYQHTGFKARFKRFAEKELTRPGRKKKKITEPEKTPAQIEQERKEEIINSGDPRLVNQYKKSLTTAELKRAVDRITNETKIETFAKNYKSEGFKRVEKIFAKADQITKMVESTDKAIKAVNSLFGTVQGNVDNSKKDNNSTNNKKDNKKDNKKGNNKKAGTQNNQSGKSNKQNNNQTNSKNNKKESNQNGGTSTSSSTDNIWNDYYNASKENDYYLGYNNQYSNKKNKKKRRKDNLSHGGPGSGRYHLGSGERPYQHTGYHGKRRHHSDEDYDDEPGSGRYPLGQKMTKGEKLSYKIERLSEKNDYLSDKRDKLNVRDARNKVKQAKATRYDNKADKLAKKRFFRTEFTDYKEQKYRSKAARQRAGMKSVEKIAKLDYKMAKNQQKIEKYRRKLNKYLERSA